MTSAGAAASSSSSAASTNKQVFHSLALPLHFPHEEVNLTLIQLGNITSDKGHNIEHARKTILEAVKPTSKGTRNKQMVILPECWNSPYGVQYFDRYAEDFGGLYDKVKASISRNAVQQDIVGKDEEQAAETVQKALEARWGVDGAGTNSIDIDSACPSETIQMMSKLAKDLNVVLLGGSIPERDMSTGRLYNTASVFDEEGRLLSLHRKLHLFDIDIPGGMTFQESKTLTAGDRVTVFECSLGRFGLGICYDLRFPEAATVASRLGSAAMLYPGAFNTTTGPRSWELLLRSRATDNQLYTVGCSPARPTKEAMEGAEKAYPTYGFTLLADPWGQVVEGLDEKAGILRVTLKKEELTTARRNVPISRQRRFDVYPDVARG